MQFNNLNLNLEFIFPTIKITFRSILFLSFLHEIGNIKTSDL